VRGDPCSSSTAAAASRFTMPRRRRVAVAERVCRFALLLCALDRRRVAEVDGADVVAVARGDGEFPLYKCPLDTLNLALECNIREAIKYLNPANSPDESYTNIRLKTHDSDRPDFVYYWDQTRAVYVDYSLRIGTRGAPDYQYAIIEGYDGPEHVEDEQAYYDAGFILVGDGGEVYLECIKFQHFNRLVLPPLSIHSYPTLDTTISHGGVLAARGGYLDILACQFYNNSAKQGGALYVAGTGDLVATVRVASATSFTSNYAQYSGGAMYIEASTPVVVDVGTERDNTFRCEDYYNLYEPTTAGITLIESDVDCGVRFANNAAGYYGGAVSAASESPPTLDYTQDVTFHEYCSFVSNSAGTDGGGLYMYYTPGVELKEYLAFSNNEATFGGGLYGSRMLTFVMTGSSSFSNNYASDCGGGMYINIAGCNNPCQPGNTDKSMRFSGNTAGNSQGTCPAATVLDDNSFGTKNCTYVTGTNCTPTSDSVDTSYVFIVSIIFILRTRVQH
jgi:predicted outer membrane repeat protein